jgi:hypothetical protein
MHAPMDATAHHRLGGKRALLVSVFLGALLAVAAPLLWQRYDDDTTLAQPEVVLGSGSFEGRDWVYGFNRDRDYAGGLCFWFRMEGVGGGCSSYEQPVETMMVYTRSGGDPEGLLTAQGVASDRVASVVCGTGTESIGQTHLFEMPGNEPLRPILCLGTASEVAGRDWFAFAYDRRGTQVARSEPFPQR